MAEGIPTLNAIAKHYGHDEYTELQRERDYWRDVAAYLASCHAATAEYDGGLRNVSKSRRLRFASICNKAAEAMTAHGWQAEYYHRTTTSEARQRCLDAAERLILGQKK